MAVNMQRNALAKARIDAVLYDLKHSYSDLIYPLSILKWKESQEKNEERKCFATDGITIFYFPEQVLINSKAQLQYEIMHIVLHGLLGHFQIKDYYKNTLYRNIIMDIQVKYLMIKWNIHFQNSQWGMNHIEKLLKKDYSMGQYYTLQRTKEFTRNPNFFQQFCRVDNHAFWDMRDFENRKLQIQVLWGDIQQVVLGKKVNIKAEIDNNQIMKALGRRLAGKGQESKEVAFAIGNSKRKNYAELLKELFTKTEVCREEPDSIDPMFYYYGLELYGDVSLIEPLETREQVVFHTLAIAIDVSCSCTDKETMECFWGETYRCISQLKEGYVCGQILLLQCDNAIQKEEKMELEEFEEVPAEINVLGSGGTSFVPVFERLAKLEGDGGKVDALLYLTDGCGAYPKSKPEYPVYFVLTGSEDNLSEYAKWHEEVPNWIQKVWLNEEER